MKKLKKFVFISIIFGILLFIFLPEVFPENFQFQEILDLAQKSDVIIIFNSGGWGDTLLERAEDFNSVVKGIQETLNEWGYHSVVLPYIRTKDNFLGKITAIKDFLTSFKFSSKKLAKEIEILREKFPDKKIILAGLCTGGAFLSETFKKFSENNQDSIYLVTAGVPFWYKKLNLPNTLYLDNNGQDVLATGNIKSLFASLIKTIFLKIEGQKLKISKIAQTVFGHQYFWDFGGVNSLVKNFLNKNLITKK
jgi:hypothetical protein